MTDNSNGTDPRIEHREEISPEIISNMLMYFRDSQTIKRAGDQIYEFDPKKINNSDLNLLSASVLKTLTKYKDVHHPELDITLGIKNLFDTHEGKECAYTVIFIEGQDTKEHLENLKEVAIKIATNAVTVDDLFSKEAEKITNEILLHDDVKSAISSHISSKSGSIIKRPFSFGSDLNSADEEYTCKRFQTVTDRQESIEQDNYEFLAIPNGFKDDSNKAHFTVFSKNSKNKTGEKVSLKCIDPEFFKVIADAYSKEYFVKCTVKQSRNPETKSLENILTSVSLEPPPSPDDFKLEHQ